MTDELNTETAEIPGAKQSAPALVAEESKKGAPSEAVSAVEAGGGDVAPKKPTVRKSTAKKPAAKRTPRTRAKAAEAAEAAEPAASADAASGTPELAAAPAKSRRTRAASAKAEGEVASKPSRRPTARKKAETEAAPLSGDEKAVSPEVAQARLLAAISQSEGMERRNRRVKVQEERSAEAPAPRRRTRAAAPRKVASIDEFESALATASTSVVAPEPQTAPEAEAEAPAPKPTRRGRKPKAAAADAPASSMPDVADEAAPDKESTPTRRVRKSAVKVEDGKTLQESEVSLPSDRKADSATAGAEGSADSEGAVGALGAAGAADALVKADLGGAEKPAPRRRGRKPKALVTEASAPLDAEGSSSSVGAVPAAEAPAAEAPAAEAPATPEEAPKRDVRPGRGRRAAVRRAKVEDALASEAARSEVQIPADASQGAAVDEERPASAPRAEDAPASEQRGAAEDFAQAHGAGEEREEKREDSGQDSPKGKDRSQREHRNRSKRDRDAREKGEKGDRGDERDGRRRERDTRKKNRRDRFNAPMEPSLSREELQAMKVVELRAKAKEIGVDYAGLKKAELVEAIYAAAAAAEGFRDVVGILDITREGFGYVRTHGYMPSRDDAFVPANMIRGCGLRPGDFVEGTVRPSRSNDKFPGLAKLTSVNGVSPEDARRRPKFSDLTPVYPNEPLKMEVDRDSITGRAIDLVAPIGKGQRGLIVSPPKAGKTTVLKKICQSIAINNPEVHLICLLVDERPEEVTDMQRSIKGDVGASTFDMPAENHTRISELVIERAKRIVEMGGDVVVVLDSITRLARAYNLAAPASGRILSGGVDSAALYPPKRFLGAARNIENGGSLTILASALVDTGSKMDEVIFEEFKGTGNMELKLDREMANRRIYPAIDPIASGTRNEDLLFEPGSQALYHALRLVLANLGTPDRAAASLIKGLKGTPSNMDFLRRASRKASGE